MNHTGRRWLITLLLALMMTSVLTAATAATGKVNVDSLVLREETSTKSNPVQTLTRNEEVEVIYKDGSWYKVKYGRYTGYVMAIYVKVSGDVPTRDEAETLRNGMKGDAVKDVQKRLKELGYLTGTADGVFGDKTEEAVKAFQKRNGLTVDGEVGKKTLEKLNSSSAKAADDGSLRNGDSGEEVKDLQRRLKELGYYTKSVDGNYGSSTVAAVKAFQKRNGLTEDGVAGKTTLNKLYSSSAKAAKDDEPAEKEDNALRSGDTGEAVKELQRRLKELGYYAKSVDGSYGSSTVAAVKAFQKRNGLTEDGVAGEATLKKLNSSSAKPAEDAKVEEKYETLRSGDRGDLVKKLQTRLKELGYYTNSIDGVYGSGTIRAIKDFQTRNGLTVDGAAGEDTQKKLYSSSAKKAAETSSDDSDDDSEELRQGSTGSAVKTLQDKLMRLGYYKGNIDGVYGTGTIAAVRAFQERNKLTVDGVAGISTLKVLYSSSAKAAQDATDKVSGELRAGDYGSDVKTLQTRLKELGYYNNSIDGSFGSSTLAAVKAFQQRNGLDADGIVGTATRTKLNSSSAKPAEDKKEEEDQEEDRTTLRLGDSGNDVKELQYRLRELGYYSDSRDGSFGEKTRTAVMAFQARNGLTVDGIAGTKTLAKLYSSSAVKATDPVNDGSSSSSGSSSSGSTSTGNSSVSSVTLNTNQTLNPGDSSDQVRAMQIRLGELGYYTNTVDGEYGYGTRQAVLAFQKNNGLVQDGIAGEDTLKKMVSSSAVGKNDVPTGSYVTERLDWFNGGASRIPRGAIFQVKDVRTGLVFTAKRQGGSSHLDAEPLTAADTAVLLKINGGTEFSWKRRPMLVLYNGRVYACSIYSEPHGSDTISGNNFDGQFCLHFYGSKTHGTDRIDPDHKECEAEALNAVW